MLCLVNYFDVWTQIVKSVGLEDLAFSDIYDEAKVQNGLKLLKIQRNQRLRETVTTTADSESAASASQFGGQQQRKFELDFRSSGEDEADNLI